MFNFCVKNWQKEIFLISLSDWQNIRNFSVNFYEFLGIPLDWWEITSYFGEKLYGNKGLRKWKLRDLNLFLKIQLVCEKWI